MRQTVRNNFMRSSGSSSSRLEWLIVFCLIAYSLAAPQYASPTYSSQYYGYNQPQLQQLQPSAYPGPSLTYTQQYPAAGQSIWSGPPIVVNDEANTLQLERRQQQEQQYFPIHNYNNRETDRFDINNNIGPTPTRRATNHNYNNVPGYFYHTQQQQQHRPPPSQLELEQRELLAVADSRREDEQLVRIGGSRSLAQNKNNNNNNNNYYYNNDNNSNYYELAQLLQRRNFQAKYAQHFEDYLRKYPQRLQPLHNTGPAFVDK